MSDPTRLTWSPSPAVVVAQAAGTVGFTVAAVAVDPVGRILVAVAALICLAMLVRSVVARPALAADAAGLTLVTGLHTVRRIPWSEVGAITTARSNHRLAVQADLVVHVRDETLLVPAGRLGARPEVVAARLATLRTGR